jgi:acetyltransferase-like isoleucine patch superfamily enzyme
MFMSWRDLTLSPLVLIGTNGAAVFAAWKVHQQFHLGLFAGVLTYGAANVILTVAFLRTLVALVGFKDGRYDRIEHPWTFYFFNLHSLVLTTNLYPFYENILFVPSTFRKWLYKLLGSKMGKGLIIIAGEIHDPCLVTVESDVIVGTGALIFGHFYTAKRELRLGPVLIRRGALIGVNAVISPGCVVGENASVTPGSILAPETIIPAGEVWSGNPAQKNMKLSPNNPSDPNDPL